MFFVPYVIGLHVSFFAEGAPAVSHLDVLLHAELRQSLLDAQRGQPRRPVGVPALTHDLTHHTQRLVENTHRHTLNTVCVICVDNNIF